MIFGFMLKIQKQLTNQVYIVKKVRPNQKDLAKVVRGVVHYEFLPTGQTAKREYYLSVMRHMREAIRKKRPELWANNSLILHHDNAPSHIALILRFSPKIRSMLLHNHRIHLIYHHVASGCSRSSRYHCEEIVLS